MISTNVINTSYKYAVKKLLNFGSSCMYPKYAPQPMKEEYLLTGGLEQTNEPYAIAKIAGIKLCRYYNEQYGTDFISVMPTNVYGPNDNFNLEKAHVISSLLRKFYLAKKLQEEDYEAIEENILKYPLGFDMDKKLSFNDNKSIEEILKSFGITRNFVVVWGTGEPYREFLFVDDLADACVFLMENYTCKDIGEFINVGTGKDLKIKKLAEIIKGIVGFNGKIILDRSKPDGTPRKLLDVLRINKLGWRPRISLEDGIKRTYGWFEK